MSLLLLIYCSYFSLNVYVLDLSIYVEIQVFTIDLRHISMVYWLVLSASIALWSSSRLISRKRLISDSSRSSASVAYPILRLTRYVGLELLVVNAAIEELIASFVNPGFRYRTIMSQIEVLTFSTTRSRIHIDWSFGISLYLVGPVGTALNVHWTSTRWPRRMAWGLMAL